MERAGDTIRTFIEERHVHLAWPRLLYAHRDKANVRIRHVFGVIEPRCHHAPLTRARGAFCLFRPRRSRRPAWFVPCAQTQPATAFDGALHMSRSENRRGDPRRALIHRWP